MDIHFSLNNRLILFHFKNKYTKTKHTFSPNIYFINFYTCLVCLYPNIVKHYPSRVRLQHIYYKTLELRANFQLNPNTRCLLNNVAMLKKNNINYTYRPTFTLY